MMNTALSHSCDIMINSCGHAAADDPTQPVIIPDTLPPLIKKRWAQAQRVNTRADWKQLAQLCGMTAINFFQDHDYDPSNTDFRSVCQLARIAHLRSVECLVQGVSSPRPSRARMGL